MCIIFFLPLLMSSLWKNLRLRDTALLVLSWVSCLGVHWSPEYDVDRNWTCWHKCDGCTEGVYLHLPNSHLGTVLMVCITSFSQEPVGQVQTLLLGGKQDSERTFPSHHEAEFVFSNRVSSFYRATCHVWQSPVVSKIAFGLGIL